MLIRVHRFIKLPAASRCVGMEGSAPPVWAARGTRGTLRGLGCKGKDGLVWEVASETSPSFGPKDGAWGWEDQQRGHGGVACL